MVSLKSYLVNIIILLNQEFSNNLSYYFFHFLVDFSQKYDTMVITKDMKRAVTFIRIMLQGR